MSGIVRVAHVSKEYPRSGMVLRDVSFEIQKGEFVFLAGHSGAGKSTLLRLLSMAEPPTSGDLRISGYTSSSIRPHEIPKLRRRLGIVFQDYRLLPDRTAAQNVAFAMEVTGVPSSVITPRVVKLLAQVGLGHKLESFPHELSGGEQQRVAIARALANEPFLLLADEPTGNLDDRATHAIYMLLREINAKGTAVLMATHDVGMIYRSGQRFIELERGELVYDGNDMARLLVDLRAKR